MSLDRFLGHLKPHTQAISGWIMRDFFVWLRVNGGLFRGSDPDELVAWHVHDNINFKGINVNVF